MTYRDFFLSVFVGLIAGRGMGREGSIPLLPYIWWGLAIVAALLRVYIWSRYGWTTLGGLIVVGCAGVLIEYVGLTTCFPYGCFVYHDLMGPKFEGSFPWILFLVWPSLVLLVRSVLSYLAASVFFPHVVMGSALLVMLDFFLDPVNVWLGVRSYQSADWYGVPWTNYLGRVFVGAMSMRLIGFFTKQIIHDRLLASLAVVLYVQYMTAFFVYVI